MSSKAMSLKAKINNYAKENNIAAQVVLQNYIFERFLARLSKSKYKDKFVIKGGVLIASIVGLDTRSTMELDTTLKGLPLTDKSILTAINDIIKINLDDDVIFEVVSNTSIRKEDEYGGLCIRLDAKFDTIITPLSIDVSIGDVITPDAVRYTLNGIFDENLSIELWGYNIETVLAEKVETVLRRSVYNTRIRDFYDIYILQNTQSFDKNIFKDAFIATIKHRNSEQIVTNYKDIVNNIKINNDLQNMWEKYKAQFFYARNISYDDIIKSL